MSRKTGLLVISTLLLLMNMVGPANADVPLLLPKDKAQPPAGKVVVQFTVGDDDFPKDIKVASTTDAELNDHAIATVKLWKFKPGNTGQRIQAPIEYNQEMVDKIKARKRQEGDSEGEKKDG